MDILLSPGGDLYVSPQGDIVTGDPVAQKIRIRLLWLEGEWRWDAGEGLPYMDRLFGKGPDVDAFESLVRAKIFEVDEVTGVRDVRVSYDRGTRGATIRYTALTDLETIKGEVRLDAGLRSDG